MGEVKFDKYNAYRKNWTTNAILAAKGRVNELNVIAFGYNFSFGGGALTNREVNIYSWYAKTLNEKLMQWFLFINQVGWALRVIFTL